MQLDSGHQCQFCLQYKNQFPNHFIDQPLIKLMYQYPSLINLTSQPWWLMLTQQEANTDAGLDSINNYNRFVTTAELYTAKIMVIIKSLY